MLEQSPTPDITLASSSPFRRDLLQRLGLPFTVAAPDIDERRLADEPPASMVTRLAEAKARAVAVGKDKGLVIGSDQAACIGTHVLGKPGNRETAFAQLRAASGTSVRFLTGLALLNVETARMQSRCEPFTVYFRTLSEAQIGRYLDAEQPFNCAGSFKSEGLGISLFARLAGDDPNALIGLPLIRLVDMLCQEGVSVP